MDIELNSEVITNSLVGEVVARKRYIPSDKPNTINRYPEPTLLYAVRFHDGSVIWATADELTSINTWEN